MCLVENAQHEKIFAYIQQWVSANKAARQLFCSSLLFCFRALNRFLEISVRDPRKILRVSQNLVLEPRKSKLDSRKLRGSRIENRVETVNLHLNGTVHECGLYTSLYGRLYCTCILLALLRIQGSIFERVCCLHKMKTTKGSMVISQHQKEKIKNESADHIR